VRGLAMKTAVVTGGASGIGRAVAERLRSDGFRVAVIDLTPTDDGFGHVADVTDRAQVDAAVSAIREALGPILVLVNAAGVEGFKKFSNISFQEWSKVIDVNLNGSYWMAQACGRLMQPGSSIVNISSVLALTTAGLPQAAYSASKAGLIGLTRDLANQWTGRKGIRVNAIAPGFFPTEMSDQYEAGYLDSMRSRMLIPRVGRLEECAATLVWLVSPAAGYVTGQTIVVDGGVSIT